MWSPVLCHFEFSVGAVPVIASTRAGFSKNLDTSLFMSITLGRPTRDLPIFIFIQTSRLMSDCEPNMIFEQPCAKCGDINQLILQELQAWKMV